MPASLCVRSSASTSTSRLDLLHTSIQHSLILPTIRSCCTSVDTEHSPIMASNDYYQHSYPSEQHNYTPYSQSPQPYHVQSAPSMHSSPYKTSPSNPYTDNIPLQNQQRIDTAQIPLPLDTTFPPSPESQMPKPALLDSPRSRRSKKKRGFFSGRVPWFVYIFTLIQVSVFIGEIIKNCKFVCASRYHILTRLSDCHWLTYNDPSILQSDDWPLHLHSDQYGRSICALHENDLLPRDRHSLPDYRLALS